MIFSKLERNLIAYQIFRLDMSAQVEEYFEDVLFAKALEDIKNKPSVPFETKTPEGSVYYFLKNPGTEAYKRISPWQCRACTNRTKTFQHLYGPNGPVFGESIDPKIWMCV